MTNEQILFEIIGEINDEHIEEVDRKIRTVKHRKTTAFASLTAVFVIIAVAIVPLIYMLMSPLGAGANAGHSLYGVTAGGCFYYEMPNDGIYRYTPQGESVKLVDIKLKHYWYDFTANEQGLYYTINEQPVVYKIALNSDTPQVLFEDKSAVSLSISYYDNTSIEIFTSKNSEDYADFASREFVIDTTTGEEKFTIFEYSSHINYDVYEDPYVDHDTADENAYTDTTYTVEEVTYRLGTRTIKAIERTGGGFTLSENGNTLLKRVDIVDYIPVKATSDFIVFSLGKGGTTLDPVWHYYIARANGVDTRVLSTYASVPEGDDNHFYYIDYDDNLICIDVRTGETSTLLSESDLSYKDLYSDGRYIYICTYNGESSAKRLKTPPVCYEIIKDATNTPKELRIIDDNIVE